jgi:hypothetical protein
MWTDARYLSGRRRRRDCLHVRKAQGGCLWPPRPAFGLSSVGYAPARDLEPDWSFRNHFYGFLNYRSLVLYLDSIFLSTGKNTAQ